MSGFQNPCRRTVYVSNIPFSLTNSDIYKICEKFGKIARVTIVKDRVTRQSKGVAFVLFAADEGAAKCVAEMNDSKLVDRTIKCSIAKDNGRASEFIKRREYKDKSRCFECGDDGHLSYNCTKNSLGDRPVPPKKRRRRLEKERFKQGKSREQLEAEDEEEDEEDDSETLSAAIQMEQQRVHVEKTCGNLSQEKFEKRKKYKKSSYFSDEEELCD